MRRFLTLVLALGLLFTACGDDGDASSTPEATEAPESELPEKVVVFTPDDTETDANGEETTWTPDAEDVLAAEAALADHITGDPSLGVEPLDQFVRQYVGVGPEDAQRVSVNALCDTATIDGWEDDLIVVSDGGTCFWQATVDPATGTVDRFTVNGSA